MVKTAANLDDAPFGTEKIRLKIEMDRDFTNFDSRQKKEYLSDLAQSAACPQELMENQAFLRGCVVHELELPAPVAKRLVELFKKAQAGDLDSATLEEFRAFLAKHSVTAVTEYKVVTIQVDDERPKKAAVFVHGWRGDDDSFGELPKWVEGATGWRSAVFSYPTGLWSHSPSISLVSASFDNWVRGKFPDAELAIIAHSMGGVVVRHCLTEEGLRETPLDIKLLVLCASPENGAVLASIGEKIPTIQKAQLRELDPNSPFLFSMNKWWDKWVKSNVPGRCRVRSIVGDKDRVVSLNNARGTDTDPVPILGADHTDIVKPISKNEEIVATITRWVRDIDRSSRTRQSVRPQPEM